MTETDQPMYAPYKLCVIDDIRSTVEVIAGRIPWMTYGIAVAGTAKNGMEGLALIQEKKPDIIVTDIRMPKMDGLEMTRQIVESLPRCKIIILSAYADFEYAKQAIKLGAFDFVKKPFAIEELTRIVLDAKRVLDKEQEHDRQFRDMERRVQMSLPLLRQEYVGRLLRHETRREDALRYWEEMQVGALPDSFAVLLVEIDGVSYLEQPTPEMELARYSAGQLLEAALREAGTVLVCRDGPNDYVCLVPCGERRTARRLALGCCDYIRERAAFTISIGIGKPASDIQQLPSAYKSAMAALACRSSEAGGVYDDSAVSHAGDAASDYDRELERELLGSLRLGDRNRSIAALEAIFAELNRLAPLIDPAHSRSLYYELALIALRFLREWVPNTVLQPYEQVIRGRGGHQAFSAKAFQQLLLDMCSASCAWVERERTSDSEKIVYRAIEYIRGNLHLDLTVEHCARLMNLSGGYFASLFKKHAGATFNQFVTRERIERAKTLLLDNHQVQEIAESLGYEHRRYFSDVFKRVTGLTPSEYKDHYRKIR